jgi:hypothetical protein
MGFYVIRLQFVTAEIGRHWRDAKGINCRRLLEVNADQLRREVDFGERRETKSREEVQRPIRSLRISLYVRNRDTIIEEELTQGPKVVTEDIEVGALYVEA